MNAPRPRVTLKLATSLDGRIAAASGKSKWITGEEARAQGHLLRAEHDAVLVGSGTAFADNPMLTCRTAGYDGKQPARVVLDSEGRLPLDSQLVASARDVPLILFVGETAQPRALESAGVQIEQVETLHNRLRLDQVFERLSGRGVQSVLVEGGGQVAASFVKADAVDRVEWFRAPILLGGDGLAAVGPLEVEAPGSAPRFERIAVSALGADLWERYVRR